MKFKSVKETNVGLEIETSTGQTFVLDDDQGALKITSSFKDLVVRPKACNYIEVDFK